VLRARFVAELDGLGVSVHDEPTADAAAGRVLALVGPRRLLAWEDAALPPSLAAALARLPPGQRIAPCAPLAEQASAEVGLTACDAAIAETGSLLLASAPGRPRTASMLPACHIAVVRDGDLHATLHGALAAVRAAHPHASGLHQITGPSRTADIELKLTLGVHGPGQVIVVLSP
jgi:L-lactate dehydrogenase complex protein LldG